MQKWLFYPVFTLLLLSALILQLHNAQLFNPLYGFDGRGHMDYFLYLSAFHRIPLPHMGWQMYQSPLYYLLGYPLFALGGIALAQYQNVFWYLILIAVGGNLISRLLDAKPRTWFLATLTLAALPVVNYLVPMLSNEFMNDTILSLTLLVICLLPSVRRDHRKIWIGLSLILLVLGFYTKYTILTLGPAYALALWFSYRRGPEPRFRYFATAIAALAIFLSLTLPLTLRNIYYYHTPLAMAESFFPFPPGREARDLRYFTNMTWTYPPDLFQAHHYSFIGGTWNTFWQDGYQVTVPVVSFHKKALILWSLGFLLSPLSVFGYILLWRKKRETTLILLTYAATALLAYILYSFHLPYPSELKAFFMSGLPIVYATGVVAAAVYTPRLRLPVLGLLLFQFIVMASYFWIQPWWHIAKH